MPPRIIHALQSNGWVARSASTLQTVRLEALRDELLSDGRDVAFVAADDVSTWFWRSPKDVWDMHQDYGPMVPPFPVMWVEAHWPGGDMLIDGAEVFRPPVALGWYVQSKRAKTHDGYHLRMVCFAMVNAVVVSTEWMVAVEIDSAGRYIKHVVGTTMPGDLTDGTVDNPAQIALLAIGFMNCKNVRVESEQAPVDRRSKRRGAPPRRYAPMGKIVIPGLTHARTSGAVRGAVGEAREPHIVRGHFKTFTPDAPLLGQHTGTYWWGHHVRGGPDAKPKPYEVRPTPLAIDQDALERAAISATRPKRFPAMPLS